MGRRVLRIVAALATLCATACQAGVERAAAAGERGQPSAVAARAVDCSRSGRNRDGSIQFIVSCPRTSRSPDGKWALVQTGATGDEESYRAFITDSKGATIGDVPGLNDAMPFALFWSPSSSWFAVNHHIGSFMDAPEVYEIRPGGVVRHDSFRQAAWAEARRMYPCLPPDSGGLAGVVFGWSGDGGKIVWAFDTRVDACLPAGYNGSVRPEWQSQPFLMISDVRTGTVVPGSIRVIDDDRPFADVEVPTDGPYADL